MELGYGPEVVVVERTRGGWDERSLRRKAEQKGEAGDRGKGQEAPATGRGRRRRREGKGGRRLRETF